MGLCGCRKFRVCVTGVGKTGIDDGCNDKGNGERGASAEVPRSVAGG